MAESIILGLVQGVSEWLPLSSEGMIIAVKNTFFPASQPLAELISLALFLHLGTFLAALIYFRKEVWQLTKIPFQPKDSNPENRKIFYFLLTATLVSGALGLLLLQTISQFEERLKLGSAFINILIAFMLILTAILQLSAKKNGLKTANDLRPADGLILGIVQGFSVIPGLSRSGLTVSALLIGKFDDRLALRLSFLMSLPVVLAGNIFLNWRHFSLSADSLLALAVAFSAGLLTINLLLRLARKINFAYFALFFAALLMATVWL